MRYSLLAHTGLMAVSAFFVACSRGVAESPGPSTPVSILTVPPLVSPSPQPSSTPAVTSTVTATPTPDPGAKVLVQYGWFGGDGIGPEFDFWGSNMPRLVLYLNGQLLIQNGDYTTGVAYERSHLSQDEMCSVLGKIAEAGFFELEDDGSNWPTDPFLYTFYGQGEWPPFGEGSPNLVIQVNGDPSHEVMILNDWLDYMIPEVATVYQLLESYRPDSLEQYIPDRMLLLIMRRPNWETEQAGLGPVPWPDNLPPLDDLEAQIPEMVYDTPHVLLEDEMAAEVYALFGNRMIEQPFSDGGEVYYITARPLLLHETPDNFSPQPFRNVMTFPLPFDCGS